jgi:hypothetical protein
MEFGFVLSYIAVARDEIMKLHLRHGRKQTWLTDLQEHGNRASRPATMTRFELIVSPREAKTLSRAT